MKTVTYIQDAVRPGGTPTRYLVWVSFVLSAQAIASILPSPTFYEPALNLSHVVFGVTMILAIGVNFLKGNRYKILAAYVLYIVGLVLSTITISTGMTSLSGIVFMLSWAMTLFVAERREYISFDLVVIFMVLMLISTVILLMFNPIMGVANNVVILATGAVITAIDIYLVYTDFGYEKNFYQESRKTYSNLKILSTKMSEILSAEGKLEHLLWQVVRECVPFLGLEECVIYLFDKEKGRLVQIAAYGGKDTGDMGIVNPIEIDPGRGIVGECFERGEAILVDETNKHPDYIVDDEERQSELAVPIISNGEVIGVIDSEHNVKGFFRERHSQAFHIMASFCGIKVTEYQGRKSIEQARIAKEETNRYKELDELKNRFIANISHDLKTPLSLIKAPAMQIAKISENEKVRNNSNYILKNTEHLLRVVNQLLQLNRIEKGLNQLYLEEIEIEQLFTKVATQYRGLAEKDNVKFKVNPIALRFSTDAFRLEQILHNLVHNAFRYTGKNGTISMTAKRKEHTLSIIVSDDGPGVSEELKTKIFDRFFKADVNNHEGTGIGLSLVKEYTTSLGGAVSLISEEGKGTSFQIDLPITENIEGKEASGLPESLDFETNGKPIMLVVEDHSDLNDFICSFFESRFDCIQAFDGEEALIRMKEQTPDIIVSDLMMPKMSGNSFIADVKSNDLLSHIPIVVLSAKSQTESRVDLYNLGVDNYLVKPFDITELEAVVDKVLNQRRQLKNLFRTNILTPEVPALKPDGSETMDEQEQELLKKALDYVMVNLDNNTISITSMAEELGIGRNRFRKEIRELTGLSPVEFVRSIRLNEAKKMLLTTKLSVSEVAYSVGFNNLSYFTRSFKSEFDMLPSEWQEVN